MRLRLLLLLAACEAPTTPLHAPADALSGPRAPDAGAAARTDTGAPDARADAGITADLGLEPGRCRDPRDCARTTGVGWCAQDPASAPSCVDGSCVLECSQGGRRCASEGDCLRCDGAAGCLLRRCAPGSWHGQIEASTAPGVNAGEPMLLLVRGDSCATDLVYPTTRSSIFGTMLPLSNGGLMARIPSLGGTCTGVELPTGAIRYVLSCPAGQVQFSY